MKKILLILPYGGVGGMERLALYFYNYYKNKGYLIKVLKFIKLKDDIILFNEDELFLSTNDLAEMTSKQRMLFYIKCPNKIRKTIKQYKITHSISFGDMANLFSSLSLSKEYKIASIHALKSSELVNKTLLNKIFKLSYKTSYYFFDKVVCISKAIKDDLIDNCSFKFKNKLEIIYNPHDIDTIKKQSKEQIIDSYENSLFDSNTIIFIGRLSLQKSPWHLINAFNLIINNYPKTKLIFIGDGQPEIIKYLNNQITNYAIQKKVFFLGRKSNPYKYLKKSNVLVLSSYYEGTPNVIIEAMALNTPIVTTNCTDGIGELMGLDHSIKDNYGNLTTEVGIITPNIFKGELNIPSGDLNIINEEVSLAKALEQVLKKENIFYKNKTHNKLLLDKFNLDIIANNYLKSI